MSKREPLLDDLIQEALAVLHHDADDGDDVDIYERDVLRKRFAAVLDAHAKLHQ